MGANAQIQSSVLLEQLKEGGAAELSFREFAWFMRYVEKLSPAVPIRFITVAENDKITLIGEKK